VANQEDVPMKQKMREIEKLYAQARAGKKGKGKGKGAAGGSRTDQYKQKGPRLDARMRSDKRGQDKVAKRMKGAGKKATVPRGAGGGPKNNKAGKNRRR
jgi:AdoMet-dependent rRNA methyltransferase SPB1